MKQPTYANGTYYDPINRDIHKKANKIIASLSNPFLKGVRAHAFREPVEYEPVETFVVDNIEFTIFKFKSMSLSFNFEMSEYKDRYVCYYQPTKTN
jgi:hypothetical protein